ncbi:helix-turn-helix domain-containing protein [Neisseria dentiae]|uniref:helix-turn-helix domain-containing protein n=1 Tax=Neisseria dentiae TaxID=194197 RepID=UPI00211BE2B2|nr:helix-turn-helix transcriptional regulator [Neisseria dentiae]MCQ9325399.1 helix-turn-helix domain-containing protein [Neisseria dentiae]
MARVGGAEVLEMQQRIGEQLGGGLQVAEILQIGNEAVSRMERGLIMPNVARLMELAEIFQCTAADLIADGSPRLFDKTHHLHLMMSELAEHDRELMLHFLERFTLRLKQAQA